MPGLVLLATAMTTHAAVSKGLFLDGLDVVRQPGVTPGYGVPIETVEVTENAPGTVSSMTFQVLDPLLSVTVTDGMEVRYEDFTRGTVLFRGWIDHFDVSNLQGDQGRVIDVQCVGVEAKLDWALLPVDVVIPTGARIQDAVQSLVGAAINVGELRYGANASGVANSTQALPVGGGTTMQSGLTITAGTSLREAIRQVAANTFAGAVGSLPWMATVDFTLGLRTYTDGGTGGNLDYNQITINDGTTGLPGEPTIYGVDTAQYRGVFIKGGNAVGTGPLTDGTGKAGPIAYIEDATILTAAGLLAAQGAFLANNAPTARGDITLSDYDLSFPNVHPGSAIQITDTRVYLSAGPTFTVTTIRKTFNPSTRENWTVSFGGAAPSASELMRRYTKNARA